MADKISLVSIIPIYNYVGDKFELDGVHKEANFNVKVEFLVQTPMRKETVLDKYINKRLSEEIHDYIFFESIQSLTCNEYCPLLIINTSQLENEWTVAGRSLELAEIETNLIDTLKILTTNSIIPDRWFSAQLNFNSDGEIEHLSKVGSQRPLMKPLYLFHGTTGRLSRLDERLEIKIKDLLALLLKLKEQKDCDYKRILELAISYFNTAHCLLSVQHSFLILTIVVEILFKTAENEKFDLALKRCKKLIGLEKELIKEICDQKTGLRVLRNSIAHGKPLPDEILKSKYDILHFIVRKSIVKLIQKQDEYLIKEHLNWF
jgi:hypothetical protein